MNILKKYVQSKICAGYKKKVVISELGLDYQKYKALENKQDADLPFGIVQKLQNIKVLK